jgi:hypothetical protein
MAMVLQAAADPPHSHIPPGAAAAAAMAPALLLRASVKAHPRTSADAEAHRGGIFKNPLPLPCVVEEIDYDDDDDDDDDDDECSPSLSSSSSSSSSTRPSNIDHTSSSSTASSASDSVHRMVSEDGRTGCEQPCSRKNGKEEDQMMMMKKKRKKASIVSLFVWPWKKIRDAYMSCMMSLDGAGDLSSLAHGATFAANTKYFADPPISKIDMLNYG